MPSADRALIEATCDATGLSQVALARVLGVDPSGLRRWITAGKSHRAMSGPARQLCRALLAHPRLWRELVESG